MRKTKKAGRPKLRGAGEESERVLRIEEVSSLRDDGPDGGSLKVSFRMSAEARAYIDSEAAASKRAKVDVVTDALFLERDIGRRLAPHRAELKKVADSFGLSLRYDLAEILSRLVEAGLQKLK